MNYQLGRRSRISLRSTPATSFSRINAYISAVVEQNIQFALIGGAQG
jgi:hypothetical protein